MRFEQERAGRPRSQTALCFFVRLGDALKLPQPSPGARASRPLFTLDARWRIASHQASRTAAP